MSSANGLIAAIQGADASIYAYGVIGAHSRGAAASRARKALSASRALRQQLQLQVAEQVPAASAFDLPFEVTDPATAARLAVLIDNRMAAVLAECAGSVADTEREVIVSAAMECAARAVTWGGASMAFPHA